MSKYNLPNDAIVDKVRSGGMFEMINTGFQNPVSKHGDQGRSRLLHPDSRAQPPSRST